MSENLPTPPTPPLLHAFRTLFGTTYWQPALYQSHSSDIRIFREILEVLKYVVYREKGLYRSRGGYTAYIDPGKESTKFNTSNTSPAVDEVWDRLRGRFERVKTVQTRYLRGQKNTPKYLLQVGCPGPPQPTRGKKGRIF